MGDISRRKEINGVKRTYWIQDITDEYKDEVVKYMVKQFVTDEPLSRYSKVYESLQTSNLKKLEEIWYEGLKCNLGLVCLTKDENGKPTIAAMNCTTISRIDDEESSETGHQILDTLTWMKKQVDAFKTLNITEYLDAMGLYVLPEYRGEGLGLEVLKAREPLCRACGITTSITLFTSIISQKLAERAGFQDLCAIDYDEIERRNPRFSYPGIQNHTKTLRLMYITYK
ncbi:n-acetyltransferase-related [Holotrichia oblita]|uniref:N-acetyltransferase-related n=1 Tax=Holotrichia oblita TaxID=644536 RepID=A0ACB9TEL5_HOLOL|nr:n-acetyltransferase-related [Holotrichia oblita]